MIPYGYLVGRGQDHDERVTEVVDTRLRQVLISFLYRVDFDEAWYLEVNDDVREAVSSGALGSALDHYATAGYFEDRLPRPVSVDEAWYMQTYPDVAEAIRAGRFPAAQQHFIANGFREGRLPHAGWSLCGDQGPLADHRPGMPG